MDNNIEISTGFLVQKDKFHIDWILNDVSQNFTFKGHCKFQMFKITSRSNNKSLKEKLGYKNKKSFIIIIIGNFKTPQWMISYAFTFEYCYNDFENVLPQAQDHVGMGWGQDRSGEWV